MRIQVWVDAKAAFQRGFDKSGSLILTVDPQQFSEEDRRLFTVNCESGLPQSGYDLTFRPTLSQPDTLGIEEALKGLRKKAAEAAEAAEKERQREAEEDRKAVSLPVAELIEKSSYTEYPYRCRYWFGYPTKYPLTCERQAEVQAECDRLNSQHQAKLEAERQAKLESEAAKLVAEQQAESDLKEWALKEGSELLRLRIAEGFDWIGLALEEWDKAYLRFGGATEAVDPEGYRPDGGEDRKQPTEEEIRKLLEIRKRFTGATVSLLRIKYVPEETEEDYDTLEPTYRTELEVKVRCCGHWQRTYYLPV